MTNRTGRWPNAHAGNPSLSTHAAQPVPHLRWPMLLAAAALLCASLAHAKDSADTEQAVAGEIIVQLNGGSDIAPLLVKHRLTLTGRFGQRDIYRLKVIGNDKVKDKITALSKEDVVHAVEPNTQYKAVEPVKNRSWAIGEADAAMAAQWAPQALRLPEAHRISTGRGIRVAVLDTGVDRRHPALAGRLLPGFDLVDWDPDPSEVPDPSNPTGSPYGHGTHVAGLVAQVAPDARILPLRILDAQGQGNLWVLAEAMLRAVDPDGNPFTDDGAHVINLSVSSLAKTGLFKTVAALVACKKGSLRKRGEAVEDDPESNSEYGITFSEKVRCSGFGGAVVVVAAGNGGSEKLRSFPAAETSSSLVSVGASNSQGWLARFSNYGWVKLAAPGAEVVSAIPGGGLGSWSGTSMAAPLVAGAAALLRAHDRNLKTDDVVKRLIDSGRKLCGTSMRQVDAMAALSGQRADTKEDKPDCSRRRGD